MTPRLGDRALFPDLAPRAYLSHCAISPVSSPVRGAVSAYLDSFARNGSAGILPWIEQRGRLRASFAGLIGADAADIALVASTTTGVVDVAFSLDWKVGDRVVVFDGEFPTNVTPWQQAAATFGLEVVRLPLTGFCGDPRPGLAELEAVLRRGARLVAVSAVQFQTGLRMPLAEMAALCHRHGAELFVDAIQAVGVVPVTVADGFDYLACGSHKWLMGIDGAAFLYVSPRCVGRLVPRLAGWLSHEDPIGFLFARSELRYDRPFRARADVFEVGATNGAGFAALGATLPFFEELGVPRIFAHVQAWHDALEPELVARGFTSLRDPRADGRSGILSFRCPVNAQALVHALIERGVAVTAPEDCLRFGPHWPNRLEEVPFVVAAVEDAVRAQK